MNRLTRLAAQAALWFLCTTPGLLATTYAIRSEAKTPPRYCRPSETDRSARPIPNSLLPLAQKTMRLPRELLRDGGYYRCAQGRLLLCVIGANLPCGKANTSRVLPPATDYCRSNPGSSFIPLAVTGHDTIYSWRCAGRIARPGRPDAKVDKEGFFQRYWKRAD